MWPLTSCHLYLALWLVSALPRAGQLTEEEVPLLFFQQQRTTTPNNPSIAPPCRQNNETGGAETPGRGWGNKLRHPPATPFSKICTSDHLTFTERRSQLPSLHTGPLRSVICFGISPIERGDLEGRRRAAEPGGVWGGGVQESRSRPNHAENPSLTVPA